MTMPFPDLAVIYRNGFLALIEVDEHAKTCNQCILHALNQATYRPKPGTSFCSRMAELQADIDLALKTVQTEKEGRENST